MGIQIEILSLAQKVGRRLLAKGWTLGTAESCTGGLISHYLTEVSGSSAYFLGGIVSYDNSIKQGILGVPESLIVAHGAVSREVALAMAQLARERLGTDMGVSATGIAGPTGGTPTKPVGTVYVAVAGPDKARAEHYVWDGDRSTNKQRSARAALELVLALLQDETP